MTSDSSQQPPTPPILITSLKERRRSQLKPLRIAPAASTTNPPSSSSSTTPTTTFSSLTNTSRLPSPPPPAPLPPFLPSTSYPTPTTSVASFSTANTSATTSSSATPTFDENIPYSNQSPQKQKRRRRSPEEFAELMSIFVTTPKPCRQLREHLSVRLNMSIREVQIWFQNQRAKISRQARLTPSTTPISNRPPIYSPTRRSTFPMGDDRYSNIPMTAVGLTHPYAASSYRQASYPPFLDRNTHSCNHPEDQDILGNSKPMLYPASPVSFNGPWPSPDAYYGEGATPHDTSESSHQRSQSQPQLFSYSNYTMDNVHHQQHLPNYPNPHTQQYVLTKGDPTSLPSSDPMTPTSSSPCSVSSSEERLQVTNEDVQTFADAIMLLAEVAAQDQTQQDSSSVEEGPGKEEILVANSPEPESVTSKEI